MGRSIKAIIAKIDEYLGTPDFSASLWKTRYVKYKIKSIKVVVSCGSDVHHVPQTGLAQIEPETRVRRVNNVPISAFI